eukprot:1801277-Pleurochrysis_carterae.AAC.1
MVRSTNSLVGSPLCICGDDERTAPSTSSSSHQDRISHRDRILHRSDSGNGTGMQSTIREKGEEVTTWSRVTGCVGACQFSHLTAETTARGLDVRSQVKRALCAASTARLAHVLAADPLESPTEDRGDGGDKEGGGGGGGG